MDMAVADLFKHKIRFSLVNKDTEQYEPRTYRRVRYYRSADIDNAESIGVNDLSTTHFKPFILHTISTVFHEDTDIFIDNIIVEETLDELDGECEEYVLIYYNLEQPRTSQVHRDIRFYPFPEHVLNGPFCFSVNVLCYFCTYEEREFYFRLQHGIPFHDDWFNNNVEPIPPPLETFRQDRCIICLESTPNILYLDCLHIAVCDSCDRLKRTVWSRKNCDVCRAEISKRIKI